jgi:hypothetical protein
MDVVSASVTPNGRAKTRPVPADFLQAAAAISQGCVQVVENLPENQRNTNVMEVTEQGDNLRENINPKSVLCRPKPGSPALAAGAYSQGFPGLSGRPCWVKRPLVAVPQNERIWSLIGATPANPDVFSRD